MSAWTACTFALPLLCLPLFCGPLLVFTEHLDRRPAPAMPSPYAQSWWPGRARDSRAHRPRRAPSSGRELRMEPLEARIALAGEGLTGQYFHNADFTGL